MSYAFETEPFFQAATTSVLKGSDDGVLHFKESNFSTLSTGPVIEVSSF
jgi:hypothetical protein